MSKLTKRKWWQAGRWRGIGEADKVSSWCKPRKRRKSISDLERITQLFTFLRSQTNSEAFDAHSMIVDFKVES